jgi:glycosyltransferase involved in cell wall biosynthesis
MVTCIIIFLNAERFLREAVDSVFGQTYQNWELLLVDDGSTDASTKLAKDYCRRFPGRVRYLEHEHHENRGMSASRNRGLAAAQGELIAFLDSDDVWVPEKLAEQSALMEEWPEAAMCYGPTLIWHSWRAANEPAVDLETEDWHLLPGSCADQLIFPPQMLVKLLTDEWTCPCNCSVMIRRSVFDELGQFEAHFRGQMEDMVFYTKVLLHKPVYVSSRCWGWYRQHSHNSGKAAMASGDWLPHQPNRARCKYLRWVKRYLEQQSCVRSTVVEALRAELKPYEGPEWAGV